MTSEWILKAARFLAQFSRDRCFEQLNSSHEDEVIVGKSIYVGTLQLGEL